MQSAPLPLGINLFVPSGSTTNVHRPELITSATIFGLRKSDPTLVLSLIFQMKNVRDLQLSFNRDRFYPSGSTPLNPSAEVLQNVSRTILQHLSVLVIYGASQAVQVLRCIAAPALVSVDCPGGVDPITMREFLEISTCRIRQLGITREKDLETVKGMLRSTATWWKDVETLRSDCPTVQDPIQKAISVSSGVVGLLKRSSTTLDLFSSLLHLDLGPTVCSVEQVIVLLISRRSLSSSLQMQLASISLISTMSTQQRLTDSQRAAITTGERVRSVLSGDTQLEPAWTNIPRTQRAAHGTPAPLRYGLLTLMSVGSGQDTIVSPRYLNWGGSVGDAAGVGGEDGEDAGGGVGGEVEFCEVYAG
ncbi:hypothetical protein BDV98DRAFT_271208 [Pterulicium gracile]|uniref:Uncharacterized protein n=1 Tax=Pterulicium gracile TaxID=1884261 RepID=A0A5C3QAB5_9AGAR|nr:hypothetical protein BDV98DRAFT_271208 [Pterula gracilis]